MTGGGGQWFGTVLLLLLLLRSGIAYRVLTVTKLDERAGDCDESHVAKWLKHWSWFQIVAVFWSAASTVVTLISGTIAVALFAGAASSPIVEYYLWCTYLGTAAACATCAALLFLGVKQAAKTEEVIEDHTRKTAELVQRRDEALDIQHRAAEMVRTVVLTALEERERVFRERLQSLTTKIVTYLRKRLGGSKYHLTVKVVADDDPAFLVDAFRDEEQRNRPFGRDELLENHIYTCFRPDPTRRWVVVDDATAIGPRSVQFKKRAEERDYRSCLAFPLNWPRGNYGNVQVSGLVGFLGLDCPDPGVFRELFSIPPASKDMIQGDDWTHREEMVLFFGVADAVAAAICLCKKLVASENPPPCSHGGPAKDPDSVKPA